MQSVTLAAVQQTIPPGAALVEMVTYQPFAPTAENPTTAFGPLRYAAYVVQREGEPLWVDLGEAEYINKRIVSLREALGEIDLERPRVPFHRVQNIARALDQEVMQRLRPLLGDSHLVLLSPDGALNLVPFGALLDEEKRFLIERFTFTYLTTGRELLRFQSPSPGPQESVIIANPDYDLPGQPAAEQQVAA
jgi:hypothetical protein